MERIITIGDIHGCHIALSTLLDAIEPCADDTIIQLGDTIDRGPNSADIRQGQHPASRQLESKDGIPAVKASMANDTDDLFEMGQLWNCEHAFEKRCPKTWESLTRTETKGIRYCNECRQNVTYCHTPEDFVRLGNAGQCVAVPDGHDPMGMQMMLTGRPSADELRRQEQRYGRLQKWWSETLDHNPTFANNAMSVVARVVKSADGAEKATRLLIEHRERKQTESADDP